MGYSDRQVEELAATIRATPCDAVIVGTPIDLMGVLDLDVPAVRIGYDLEIVSGPSLEELLAPVS